MSPTLRLCCASVTMLAIGCVSHHDPVAARLEKSEAEDRGGRAEDGTDLCELYGFYGDGECDTFCPEPDRDCPICLAFPTCDAGETMHERRADCPADTSCREVSLCGSTIWCAEPRAVCAAYPSCAAHETEYERAEDCPADAGCREVSLCGATIWCGSVAVCLAVPTCEEGETAHVRQSDCPADASCREVSLCGSTIWCSSTEAPECAGKNPAGCIGTGCPDGFVCDSSVGSAPSACACDPEAGTWVCTADLNGGSCVPEEG